MTISVDLIKKLREETQAGVADCKKALEGTKGDFEKAKKALQKKGFEIAAKKAERATSEGLITSYIHTNNKVGVLLEILCETDFVARTTEFKNLAHEIAMQIASMNPKNVSDLLSQDYIREAGRKVEDLLKEIIGKLGENIVVKRFIRFEIGDSV